MWGHIILLVFLFLCAYIKFLEPSTYNNITKMSICLKDVGKRFCLPCLLYAVSALEFIRLSQSERLIFPTSTILMSNISTMPIYKVYGLELWNVTARLGQPSFIKVWRERKIQISLLIKFCFQLRILGNRENNVSLDIWYHGRGNPASKQSGHHLQLTMRFKNSYLGESIRDGHSDNIGDIVRK